MTAITIIAEFCQNHNGDFDLLAKMVESAVENGATHGKIQTIFAENLTFRPQFEQGLNIDGSTVFIKRPYQTEYDRLKKLEISFEEMEKFCLLCRSVGLEPVTTCFAREHVGAIQNAGFNTVKVASYDCASYQLLRELKNTFSKIIVSTGATFDDEIELASTVLDGASYAFLHCVTIYPTPLNEMHLSRLKYLRQFTAEVGFSDHSLVSRDGIIGSKAALALGATSIERHFTLLSPEDTKDGPVSIGPSELLELAEFSSMSMEDRIDWMNNNVPVWSQTIGQKARDMTDTELLNRDYYRGRFASIRYGGNRGRSMIDNWEEIPVK